MSAASPQEGDQQASAMDEEFRRVFGESAEKVVRKKREEGAGMEAVRARARRVEAAPSERAGEEHNLGYGVFRSWCPHCVKGRAEAYRHVRKVTGESDVPITGVDYSTRTAIRRRERRSGCPSLWSKKTRRR